MSDPRERVFDHALERIFRGDAHDEELTERILAALEEPEERAEAEAASAPRRYALPIAASFLIATGIGAALWFAQPDGRAPEKLGELVARARSPLAVSVYRGDALEPVTVDDVRAGDTLYAEQPTRLELVSGGTWDLGRESLVRVGAVEGVPWAALALGSLRAETATDGGLVLQTVQGSLSVRAGVPAVIHLWVELAPGTTVPSGAPALWVRERLLADAAPERVVRLAMASGAAILARTKTFIDGAAPAAGMDGEALAAGDVRILTDADRSHEPLAADDEAWLVARVAEFLPIGKEPPLWEPGGYGAFDQKATELFTFLDESTGGWRRFEDLFSASFADPETSLYARHTALNLLAWSYAGPALSIARRLWLESPESFEPYHVLAFAEGDAFELERELRAYFDEWKDPYEAALPAAFLALRGDEDAVRRLEDLVSRPPSSEEQLDEFWLAAIALDVAGRPYTLRRIRSQLERDVESALSSQSPQRAAMMVLCGEFYLQLRVEADPPQLGFLEMRFMVHLAERGPLVQTPAEIREALAALSF
ncbi:MAG: hypothetical protein O7B99_09680 [Planctomycetota bacterium]|nr:hypothetical protein [Planctomycetota bacterium]